MNDMDKELKKRVAVHGPVPAAGYDANGRCVECLSLWPGHKLDCRTDNERAAKYQRALPSRRKRHRNVPAMATRGLGQAPENHAGDDQSSGLPSAHGSASDNGSIP